MSKKMCPDCGAENLVNAKYCVACGHEIPAAAPIQMDSSLPPLPPPPRKKNKAVQVVIAVLCAAVLWTGIYFVWSTYFRGPLQDKVLQGIAMTVNQKCPVVVDEVTRLDSVSVQHSKNALQYNYTLSGLEKLGVPVSELKDKMMPRLVEQVKTNAEMELLRKMKITFVYNYLDEKGTPLIQIIVTPDMYGAGK